MRDLRDRRVLRERTDVPFETGIALLEIADLAGDDRDLAPLTKQHREGELRGDECDGEEHRDEEGDARPVEVVVDHRAPRPCPGRRPRRR